MGDDAHEAVALGEAGEDPDGLLKALVVQRAEAFIEEEGVQPDAARRALDLVREAKRQRQGGFEALTAREGLDAAAGAVVVVDDAEVEAGLAALVLGAHPLQLVLPGGHLHQAGVGVAQDAVQIVHLDVGFQFDLLFAGQGAARCGGKGTHPLPALFKLSARFGSGAVFFSGCTLKCCYCQNYPISQGEVGKAISVERLTEIFMNLQNGGAKNVNLVTASQYLPWVTAALDAARAQGFSLPVVYNTGGYETVDAVRALAGYVDIWLADYKYASPALAKELSAAQDYPQVAHAAIRQMLLQTGAPVYDADGYLQKGVIVRHLALPGHSDDSLAVLQRLADLRQETGVSFVPSLMSQFTPFYRAAEHGLGRRITTYEYRKVVDRAIALGLTDGYMQEKSSAREEYTPPFDLEGV